jgi:hypothetical protein
MSQLKAAFDVYFARWGIVLPEDALLSRAAGTIHDQGWHVRYRFDTVDGREVLDFYAAHRMTNDRHVRIDANGKLMHLDSMLDAFSYNPAIPGDKERAEREYLAHNQRIHQMLSEKWPDEA